MHKMHFWVRRKTDPRTEARRVIEALRKNGDETVVGVGYGRNQRVDRVLRAIDVLVRAELPAAQCIPYYRGRERVYLWALGREPTSGAFLAR